MTIGSGRAKQLSSDAPLHQLALARLEEGTGEVFFVYNKPYYDEEKTFTSPSEEAVGMDFSPDENMLAIADAGTNIEVYDTSDWSLITSFDMGGFVDDEEGDFIFSADGEYIAITASETSDVIVYRTSDWTLEQTIDTGNPRPSSIDFSPDGNYLAVGDDDGNVKIYNTSDWSLKETIFEDQSASPRVFTVSFSPDSSLIAHAPDDTNIYINNVSDGSLDQTLTDLDRDAIWAEFSQRGELFGSAEGGEKLCIYDTSDWSVQTTTLDEELSEMGSASFSPDGTLLAFPTDHSGLKLINTSDLSVEKSFAEAEVIGNAATFSPKGF